MDHSDLPKSARARIKAAEFKAQTIFEVACENAAWYASEARRLGVDPSGSGLSPGSRPLELARERLVKGSNEAACYLFGAVAQEFWGLVKPDVEAFTVRLNAIGEWVRPMYGNGPSPEVCAALVRNWRAWALRERAATVAKDA